MLHGMPKREIDDFISHWKGATAPEQSISVIHWLRPEYQTKDQQGLILPFTFPAAPGKPQTKATDAKPKGKAAWPKTLPEPMHAVETALHAADRAKQFARAKPADVTEILKTLETFGRARKAAEGKFRI
jgi:hypothetical protein